MGTNTAVPQTRPLINNVPQQTTGPFLFQQQATIEKPFAPHFGKSAGPSVPEISRPMAAATKGFQHDLNSEGVLAQGTSPAAFLPLTNAIQQAAINLQADERVHAVEKMKDKSLLSETEGTKESKIKLYCHRCCSKGHVMAGCVAPLFCQICEANDHVAVKCPHKKNPRPVAHMVGYARDELGFFHIPHGPVKTPITNSSSDNYPPITLTKG